MLNIVYYLAEVHFYTLNAHSQVTTHSRLDHFQSEYYINLKSVQLNWASNGLKTYKGQKVAFA